MVKEADNLNTEDRIAKIATIFSYFHNPDKETVLTPWRVVNMHMSDTVGGWCFFNEEFDAPYTEENKYGENVNAARPVGVEVDENNQLHFTNEVTKDIFGDYNSRILEINSKQVSTLSIWLTLFSREPRSQTIAKCILLASVERA